MRGDGGFLGQRHAPFQSKEAVDNILAVGACRNIYNTLELKAIQIHICNDLERNSELVLGQSWLGWSRPISTSIWLKMSVGWSQPSRVYSP